MKIVIGDREYDGTLQPFIGDLRLLKPEFGFGWGTVANRLSSVDVSDMMAALDDEEFIDALVAWVWMARLRAGERGCTRADVEQLALDQIKFVMDDEKETDVAAVPTPAPTDSGRGGEPAAAEAAAPTRASTRTSRTRSTAASR